MAFESVDPREFLWATPDPRYKRRIEIRDAVRDAVKAMAASDEPPLRVKEIARLEAQMLLKEYNKLRVLG